MVFGWFAECRLALRRAIGCSTAAAAPSVGGFFNRFAFRLAVAALLAGSLAANAQIVANAGADQTVFSGDTVTLDSSASTFPGGENVGYLWAQTAGDPTVTLQGNTLASASFVAPTVSATTTLTFSLTIFVVGNMNSDTMTVLVRPPPPAPPPEEPEEEEEEEGIDGSGLVMIDPARHRETDTGHPHMGFVAYLLEPATERVTVWYRTRDGTAEAGKDYYASQGRLVIEPGQLAQTIWVPVIGDLESEPDETLEVVLDAEEGEENSATVIATGTILDNDFPSLSVASATVDEGNEGQTPISFMATLSAPSPRPVHVAYATRDRTAKAGEDYEAASGRLTFAVGEVEKPIVVNAMGDRVAEGHDRFEVVLSEGENVKMAKTLVAAGVIVDDDQAQLSIRATRAVEGAGAQARFEVSLSIASARSVAVGFITRDGTARRGSDYMTRAAELLFPPGVQSREVAIELVDDELAEADETFTLELIEPENAILAFEQASALATIVDDDGGARVAATAVVDEDAPRLSVALVAGPAGGGELGELKEEAGASAVFSISLAPAVTHPVSVSYRTEDATARAGQDYRATTGVAEFAPGTTEQRVVVPLLDDDDVEPAETFRLRLSAPRYAELEVAAALATIGDDDGERRDAKALDLALAGFSQAFAASAVDAIADRLFADAESASTSGRQRSALPRTLAAESSGLGSGLGTRDFWAAHPSDWAERMPTGHAFSSPQSRQQSPLATGEDPLLGFLSRASFDLQLGGRDAGRGEGQRWRLWGSGSAQSLSDLAADGGWQLGGNVYATHLGVAATAGRAAFGATISHGRGSMRVAQGAASGEASVDMTAVLPFLRWRAGPGLDLWGIAGGGRGRAVFDGLGDAGCAACGEGGVPLRMRLLALGVRQDLARVKGFDLAIKSDALAVKTETSLAGAVPHSERLRLMLDARRTWLATAGVGLATNLALGGRWDRGGVASGSGMELGGGLDFKHRRLGLGVRGRGRVLLAGADGRREWGGDLAVDLDPGAPGVGLSLRLQPTWGLAGSADSLWRSGGLHTPEAASSESMRWDMALGYGLRPRSEMNRRLLFGLSRDEWIGVAHRVGGELARTDALRLRVEVSRQAETPAYGLRLEGVGRF